MEADGELGPYLSLRTEPTSEPMQKTLKVLKSFVIPKHHLPDWGEKLLAMPVENHPWDYKDFHGKIPNGGYGAGTVKLLHSGNINVLEFGSQKIKFEYKDAEYVLFEMGDTGRWLIMRK